MIRTGWRIVPEELAATAFDGEGARLFGGRWNSAGMPVVYAAAHLSLAALEVRVHIDRTSMKKRYKCLTFEFDDRLMATLPTNSLPKHWQQEPPYRPWVTSGSLPQTPSSSPSPASSSLRNRTFSSIPAILISKR